MAVYADRHWDDFAAFVRYAAREIALDAAEKENPLEMTPERFQVVRDKNYQALVSATTRGERI